MRIAVLTSTRADYGIYFPLLNALKNDPFFDLDIIAFGTHLSEKFGHTANLIEADGFTVTHRIDTMPDGDLPMHISAAMGKTLINFSKLWIDNQYDIVFALGDRYEMFAAVTSSVPYQINIAHIHGGEATLGAIDNAFRHSITHMSAIHFTSADYYRNRVIELTGSDKNVYNSGALSFDNLQNLALYDKAECKSRFGIDLNIPSILITLHPETVAFKQNEEYTDELIGALSEINTHQFIITMPNADTMGNAIRKKLQDFIDKHAHAFGFENLGTVGYLSVMKHSSFMLGNTSSGCIEASYFPKWVINLGDRQKGRIATPNMINCSFNRKNIISAIQKIASAGEPEKVNIYGSGNAAQYIVNHIKTI
jgi:GDP/UDP-N,N'-diacetylbacillosamine 2-epimerase (hydrolysing)